MQETEQMNDRLANLLDYCYSVKGYSWSALEGYIRNANGGECGTTVDRRKLARLHAGEETVTLSMKELKALHIYFYKRKLITLNESMLFCLPHNLLDAFQGEMNLTVFYPARYQDAVGTEVASHWDLRAIAELLKTTEIGNLTTSLQDVFHFGKDCVDPKTLLTRIKKETWYRKLDGENALLSLGSPFVSYSTEEILCRMFGLEPFRPQGYSADNPLPFYLYWPDEIKTTESAFSITQQELDRYHHEDASKVGRKDRALLMNGNVYLAESNGHSYNLVLAQYWRGHFILVLIGIFAPATFAIAQCISSRQIEQTLPHYYTGTGARPGGKPLQSHTPILIALIRTLIEEQPPSPQGERRDNRELRPKETEVIISRLWECIDNRWKPQ